MDKIHARALRPSASYSPLLMTIAGGFLKQEGREASHDVAGPGKDVPEGIRDGTVQLAQSAVSTRFAPLAQGEPVPWLHFAQINVRDGFFLAGRQPEPGFRWDRLIGKTVLVDHFFQPLAMFRYALYRQGVDIGQLNVVDAGDVAAIDRAFRTGAGDYVHQQGPAPQQLGKDGIGFAVAAVGAAIGPVAFSSLCASREWLKTAATRAFMRAYRRVRAHTQSVPAAEIVAAEASFFRSIDRDVLTQTIADYRRRFAYAEVICAPLGEDIAH